MEVWSCNLVFIIISSTRHADDQFAAEVVLWESKNDWSLFYVAIMCHAATLRSLGNACEGTPSDYLRWYSYLKDKQCVPRPVSFSFSFRYHILRNLERDIVCITCCPSANQNMAELGLACSVIQVLQVEGALLTQAYEYGETVKNAEKDIKHVIEELKGTEEILLKLKALAEEEEASAENFKHWPTLEKIKNGNGYLAQCKTAMIDLQKRIPPVDG